MVVRDGDDVWSCGSCGHTQEDMEAKICSCGGLIIQASQIIPGASASTWICSECQKTRNLDQLKASRRKSLVNTHLPRSTSLEQMRQKKASGRCCGLFSAGARSSYVKPNAESAQSK